ncbi:uncharacterized protein I206_100531 [Kwoniella pini CBS 10737]|uniref:Uncharacterized protein n=1 Tax=Kwoniella pini CBS 10737 TaxID=1296096 RepID=A0A1B9IDJ6_9TREE|nr:uncharacterized protein I206_00796 [Kwoniella pini CBS 10737]OCF53491.1 hypothetical protein I206_00796 [Kwoniella pini CBS 10737]
MTQEIAHEELRNKYNKLDLQFKELKYRYDKSIAAHEDIVTKSEKIIGSAKCPHSEEKDIKPDISSDMAVDEPDSQVEGISISLYGSDETEDGAEEDVQTITQPLGHLRNDMTEAQIKEMVYWWTPNLSEEGTIKKIQISKLSYIHILGFVKTIAWERIQKDMINSMDAQGTYRAHLALEELRHSYMHKIELELRSRQRTEMEEEKARGIKAASD